VKDDKESESIEERLEAIERMLQRYLNDDYIQYVRRILGSYFRLINIYLQEGRISPSVIFPEVKDPIAREIIEVLFQHGSLNTTEISNMLRERRGTASRKTVREKLQGLMEAGIVECREKKGEKEYYITESVVRRWLKVLGIDIRSERDRDDR
jgi:DNA-binding transcriptional ArsR family regulator